MYTHESHTYTQLAEEFDKACSWLADLGIHYSATRIGHYKRRLDRLARHQSAGRLEEIADKVDLGKFANAYQEAAELVRIFHALRTANEESFTSRLRDSMRGHELHVMDEDDRSGRDVSFELSMAADFAGIADSMNFGHVADLEMRVDSALYFVECKRLRSVNRVKERIAEGLRQLRNRYAAADGGIAKGILCLSVSRVLNPSSGFMECRSEAEISNVAVSAMRPFQLEFSPAWRNAGDARTIGVVTVLDTVAITTNRPVKMHTVHQLDIDVLSEDGLAFFVDLQMRRDRHSGSY